MICKWIVSSETVQPDECTYYATDQTFLAPACTRTMVRKYHPYIVWLAGWVLDGTFLKGNSWFSPPHPHPALQPWRNEGTPSLLMQSMCNMVIFPSDICDLIFFNVNWSFFTKNRKGGYPVWETGKISLLWHRTKNREHVKEGWFSAEQKATIGCIKKTQNYFFC